MAHRVDLWRRMNALPAWRRRAVKASVFALLVLIVLFPDLRLLVRHVRHLTQLDRLVEPDAKVLGPIERQLDPLWSAACSPKERLRVVQGFVESLIAYDWDWNTWLVADYLPTVQEVLERRREDCDGRAVLAASLLRSRGYDARLVANFSHMWVWTEHGEIMHPVGRRLVESTPEGIRIRWRTVWGLPLQLAFGVAVFPMIREVIIVGGLWWLLLRPGLRWRAAVAGGILMLAALAAWRYSAFDPRATSRLGCWMGLIAAGIGVALCILACRGSPRKADA